MHTITTHTAIAALHQALEPGAQMIDGRTERDRLWFLTEFGSLINFYNSNNEREGSWKPMLMKDPVFLLASISKTAFTYYHSRYRYTCLAITDSIGDTANTTTAYKLLAQLFGRLYDVYQQLSCWTYYMEQGIEAYELKTYVMGLVQSTFGPYYWSLMAMRKYLFANYPFLLQSPEPVPDGPTDYFGTPLWQDNKGSATWWQILGFTKAPDPLDAQSPGDAANYRLCFDQLNKVGDDLFGFFKSIIAHAMSDFEKMSLVKSHYPDTTLLRAFIKLLGIQQQQLNGLASKHLDFYYQQLLQQRPLPAQPDTAFLCATLKTGNAVCNIASGTGFMAGVDANKNPIVFTTTQNETINPAFIAKATTVSFMQDTTDMPGLYMDADWPIATAKYQANGQAQSWPSFGGSPTATAQATAMGIAFASPMLYLPEGTRTITCHLQFATAQDNPVLEGAGFYLSTEKNWLPLSPIDQIQVDYLDTSGAVVTAAPFAGAQLTIQLDTGQPAIQAFAVNPDGYACAWPLLKILFTQLTTASSPVCIQSLTIATTVVGLKNLRLFNDNGALATKGPFAPFGPMPIRNSQFIIGSNEIFSKPFTQLSLQFNWANLPGTVSKSLDNFETYYSAYNQYSQSNGVVQTGSPANDKVVAAALGESKGLLGKLTAPIKWIGSKIWQGLQWVGHTIKHVFKGTSEGPQQPFNNGCFTVDFGLLSGTGWQKFAIQAPVSYTLPPTDAATAATETSPPITTVQPYGVAQSLFRVNEADNLLTATTIFEYPAPVAPADAPPTTTDTLAFTPNPTIQNMPLDYTDATDTGFMRMAINGPAVGFGSEMYPSVVSWIATQNAMNIAKSADWFFWNEPVVAQNANLPFAPSIANLTAQYSASVQYDLTEQTGSYPLQCFLYSPFANYAVYNNMPGQSIPADTIITDVGGMAQVAQDVSGDAVANTQPRATGVPLFPAFAFTGALFLQLQQLIPSTINIYVELAGKYEGNNVHPLYYRYLSPQGWQPLLLLQDGTGNFSCSGIIKLGIPDNIASNSTVMPGDGSWICIATDGNLAAYAQTVYLNVNGFAVQRSGTDYLSETTAPYIPSNTITKPLTAIPSLGSLLQPFASFGGAAKESIAMMNRRVSARIHTKDRLVTAGDFYVQLCQEFSFLFYCKVYAANPNNTGLYLVRKVAQDTQPNAYLPFVSACEAQEVQGYIGNRVRPLANCTVQNFVPQYISIYAMVTPLTGYSQDALKQAIGRALNLYLSPWISSTQKQAAIDQPLTDTDIAGCILGVAGVGAVTEVRFKSEVAPSALPCKPTNDFEPNYTVQPISPAHIMVSSQCHTVQFNNAA